MGCASRQVVKPINEREGYTHTYEKIDTAALEAQLYFLIARDLERKADTNALHAYEMAYKSDTLSEFLPQYISALSLINNQPNKALYYLRKKRENDALPDSTLRQMGAIYLQYGMYRNALPLYASLDSMGQKDSLFYAILLEKNGKYLEAEKIVTSLKIDTTTIGKLKRADLLRNGGELDSAKTLYQEILANESYSRGARKGEALTLLFLDSATVAIGKLEGLISEENDSTTPIDPVIHEAAARYYASLGQLTPAINTLEPLYTKKGSNMDLYYGRMIGVYLLMGNRIKESQAVFKELLTLRPKDPELHYFLGAIYGGLQEVDSAAISYEKALEIKDSYIDAYSALALLYLDHQKFAKAKEVTARFVEKRGDVSVSWGLYGALLNMEKSFPEAIKALEKAVALDTTKKNTRFLFELGIALDRGGEKSRAEETFGKILAIDSTHASAANYLGYVWAEDGRNLEKAKELIQIALKDDPKNGAYLDSYGWVFYKLGNYEKALKYLTQALEDIKDDYVVYYHIGDILVALNRKEEALPYYKKANSFENDDKESITQKIEALETELFQNGTE